MTHNRRPTSFFVDTRGVRTGRLLVLAVLAAMVGSVAMAGPAASDTVDASEPCAQRAVHADVRE